MTFAAPQMLATLAIPAVLLWAYALRQRRSRRYVLAFTDLATIARAVPRRPQWRRHVGALTVVLAAAVLALASARPTVARTTAAGQVYLAIDVSLSMAATDVAPSRLESARAAARAFLDAAPHDVAVGLITFAGQAGVAVPPTTDRLAVSAGLDGVRLRAGTATGDAILAALDDLATRADGPGGIDHGEAAAHVVLLSDGERTVGVDPLDAAERAADAGVRVSAVALGTADGTIDVGGEQVPVPVDVATLRQVAKRSGGSATEATTADQLTSVFAGLAHAGMGAPQSREVTHVLATGGLVLLALGAVAVGRWGVIVP